MTHLGTVTLPSGDRLIVKDGMEVMIPKPERDRILEVLHRDHMGAETMIRQCKSKVWWPKMREAIKRNYEHCKPCTENRASRPQVENEISMKNIFDHFYPGEEIQIDFAQHGTQDYLVVACVLTGFIQVYEVKNKTAASAVAVVKEWSATFGRPYRIKCDSGPGFRQTFESEINALGMEVLYSSAYNPASNGLVERAVKTLKDILKRCGKLTTLQLKEMIFCSNSREQVGGAGSPFSRFMGHGVRGGVPNSFDRSINWENLMKIREDEHDRRVQKPGRKSKEQYEVGEEVLVQDMKSKKWDKSATVTDVRVAHDNTIVSYVLAMNGAQAI